MTCMKLNCTSAALCYAVLLYWNLFMRTYIIFMMYVLYFNISAHYFQNNSVSKYSFANCFDFSTNRVNSSFSFKLHTGHCLQYRYLHNVILVYVNITGVLPTMSMR